MNRKLFFFLLGRIAIINGGALALPLIFALCRGESGWGWFFFPMVISFLLGGLLLQFGRDHRRQLTVAQGSWYMVTVWFLLGGIGMIPYIVSGLFAPVDAFFQSVSAYTTTGLTSVALSEGSMPSSLLLWNAVMEWLGGLNFLVLLVTIVPQVSGCFGITLSAHQSIAFSPMIGRMEETAWQTGRIYIGITLISIICYFLAGLSLSNAFSAALSTISTGGNSGFDFIRFDNPWLELAGGISMILASGNFLLYWKGIERRDMKSIFQDTELRIFLCLIAVAGLVISGNLWYAGVYAGLDNLRYGFFQVVSFVSTTGFSSTTFTNWPDFDCLVLFLLVFVGGCIGSVTGGMRIMRFIVLFKMAVREMHRIAHPSMVICIKINSMPVNMKIVSRVLSYFFLFMAVFFVSMIIISLSGVTTLQAMGIAAGCLSSAGATAELFGPVDMASLPAWIKIYCSFLMILGRIEIFSFLIVMQTIGRYMRRRW
ncbi:MAG: TrkH family potassium uptake protein [Megasphaera sp.]|jgi:trk system potassium uptake protein TrkH|nr:TrkH family potassium uptake protein [Megasphaera sp.]MCI1247956.1 TrkH family potassium uptake protein [Megasphaera sp.]